MTFDAPFGVVLSIMFDVAFGMPFGVVFDDDFGIAFGLTLNIKVSRYFWRGG